MKPLQQFVLFFTILISSTILYAATCDDVAFYNSLAQSESGGCGGGNQYNCTGPVITSGMHKGDRPLGKYQFMPKTLRGMGIDPNNFVGNAAAQEAAIRQFTADNDACLQRNGAYNHIGQVRNGVTITRSGLLGAAHLGGCGGAARWAKTGRGPSDQLGTSLANYAGKFEGYGMFGDVPGGTCGGGVANAADQFAQAQALGFHNILGCDPEMLERGKTIIDAMNQLNVEIAQEFIQPPTSIEQLTCADQQLALVNEIGGIQANPGGNLNNSNSLTNLGLSIPNPFEAFASGPLNQQLSNFANSAMSITSGISGAINTAFGNVQSLFGGGGGGGVPSTNCTMMEDAWLINQCVSMPQIPSLDQIIGGQVAEITGAVTAAANMLNPERLFQQACQAGNSAIQGITGDISNTFEDAADVKLNPITDALP
jgi:hypothetical protein